MNCSAEKSSRKLDIGARDRRVAAMVTAAALLLLCTAAGPAMGREVRLAPPLDLFGKRPPRTAGTVHPAAIPLPRPRPAEAPGGPGKPERRRKNAASNGEPEQEALNPPPCLRPAGWR